MSRPKLKKKRESKSKLPEGTYRLSDGTVAEDIARCPFCGGQVGVVMEEGKQAMIHSLPICEKYQREDPLVFLHSLRMKVVGPLPDDDEWPMPSAADTEQEPS
jgi:hypothetical protein